MVEARGERRLPSSFDGEGKQINALSLCLSLSAFLSLAHSFSVTRFHLHAYLRVILSFWGGPKAPPASAGGPSAGRFNEAATAFASLAGPRPPPPPTTLAPPSPEGCRGGSLTLILNPPGARCGCWGGGGAAAAGITASAPLPLRALPLPPTPPSCPSPPPPSPPSPGAITAEGESRKPRASGVSFTLRDPAGV